MSDRTVIKLLASARARKVVELLALSVDSGISDHSE